MSWAFSSAFLLFFALICIGCIFFFLINKRKSSLYYSSLNVFSNNHFSLRVFLSSLPFWLKIMALSFAIMALARPQTISNKSEQNVEGIDIMIVMDISLSMLVADMGQGATRLAASKKVVSEFVNGRISDRMGLILFSGESFTSVPLTLDYELILSRLKDVKTDTSIDQGTAIGVALANAVARLKQSRSKSKVVVFLTDGENNTGFISPETALRIVKNNNIKVYTIGVGTVSGRAPILFQEKRGNRVFQQKAYVDSRINKKLMQEMASETGGQFFMAQGMTSLRKIFNQIDELEKQEIKINQWVEYQEHFVYFLLIAIVLYALSLFLSLTVFFRGV